MSTIKFSRGEAIAKAKTVITQMHGVESDEFQKIVDELAAVGFNKIPMPSKNIYNEVYHNYCIIVALNPIGKSGKEIKNSYEFEQACDNLNNELFVWYSSPDEIKKLSSKHMSIGRRWVSNDELPGILPGSFLKGNIFILL